MATHIVETVLASEISADDQAALQELGGLAFPPEMIARFHIPVSAPAPVLDWPAEQAERVFFIRRDGRIIAASRFLPRRIRTPQGPLDVLALAGVMSHPEYRHQGLGRAVVRAAFDHVDRGVFPVSLFQTGVPEFYNKLGCRRVTNPFTNSLAANPTQTPWMEQPGTPWWEQNIMIYPATYPWPEGPINLEGPGW